MVKRIHIEALRVTGAAVTGLVFWHWANSVLGTREPWDAPDYPYFYLGSLGLCAAIGYLLPMRPWRWGLIVIFVQLPLMVFHTWRLGPLAGVGIILLTLQALPAMLVATVASRLRNLKRRR